MRAPPTRRKKHEDEDEFVKKDLWEKYPRGGSGGGGGGDYGSGDGGNDDGDEGGEEDDGFFVGTPPGYGRGRGRKHANEYEYGRLFGANDAEHLPGHNGEEKGGLWRRKVSYYLISKYPDMEHLLEFV